MAHLNFHSCDTVQLAEQFGTPLYVVSEDEIVKRIHELKASFDNKYEQATTYYASKAFLTKDMVRILMREEIGMDAVSGGELFLASTMGFPMEKIMFHGNSKTIEEIKMGLSLKIGRFVCDSIDEIQVIDKLAGEMGVCANVLFRVSPGINSHTHSYIATAQADSKFGVPLSKINDAIEIALQLKNVNVLGFHFHVGSQLLENTSHLLAVEITLNLIKRLNAELGFVTKEFNLGGGFGIRYTNEDVEKPAAYFIAPMVEMIETFCHNNQLLRPKLMVEPGRWIVGQAGITLYTVGSIKEIPGIKTYAGVDGGLPDNIRPALYQAVYDAVVANKYGQEATQTVTIAGKCCESGDILIHNLKTPQLERGDILAVKGTGAYNYSMASNYNKLTIPAVVMIKDGEPHISVKRQSFEDLFARDI